MRPGDAQHLLGALSGVETPVGFAVFDDEHRFLAINSVLAARSGRPVAEHLGRSVVDVLPATLATHTTTMINRILDDGQPFEADEPPVNDGDDSSGRLRSSWYVVGDGRSREIAMFVVDDTTHRLTIDALQHSRARNSRLLGVADRFAVAMTVDEVVDTVTEIGSGSVGARWSSVVPVTRGRLATQLRQRAGSGERWGRGGTDPMVAEVMRTGWPLFLPSKEDARAATEDQEERAAIDSGGEEAWAVLPVTGPTGRIAALRFAFDAPQQFASETRRFLRAVAQQCSAALGRASLFDEERTATESLTQGLRPPRLPAVPGLELAARSAPTAGDETVGGDWYDAFVVPHGAIGLVVGDVMGHGLQAAAGMGQVRAALRALALADPDPGTVLTGLDRLVESGDVVDLATVAYAVVDPATGHVMIGDAGHLPLARIPVKGNVELVDAGIGGTPLGVSEPRKARPMRLRPGDAVLGFTDGLVENRERGLEAGFERLLEFLDRHREDSLEQLLEELVTHMIGDERGDDVTVLALRWDGATAVDNSRVGVATDTGRADGSGREIDAPR